MGEKEFEVIRDDVSQASTAFRGAADSYQKHMPNGGRFVRASGGDPQLDKIIDVSLGTIEEMHTILVQALQQHGAKLGLTAEKLTSTEVANTQGVNNVLQHMMKDDPPGLDSAPSY